MTVSLLITGPDTLSFDWQGDASYAIRFQLDEGTPKEFGHTYPLSTWQTETVSIPAGTHLARWELGGGGMGLLDRVQLTSGGKPRLEGPHIRYFTLGQPVNEDILPGAGSVAVTSGSLPAGLALNASGQLTGTPSAQLSAEVTLTLTAPAGADAARFAFVVVPPLAETVGQAARPFTTGGTGSGAAGYYSQPRKVLSGASLLSPPLATAEDTAWIETALNGPVQVTWWQDNHNHPNGTRKILVNGSEPQVLGQVQITAGWVQFTMELPGGSHTIRWLATGYDGIGPVYEAGLYSLTITPYGVPVFSGASTQLRYQAGELIDEGLLFTPTLITVSPANLPPWLNALRALTGTAPGIPGTYTATLNASNAVGTTAVPFSIEITPRFRDALNATQLDWDVSGSSAAPWFLQSAVSRDGLAMQSGAIPHGQKSTLRTRITGPGVLSFGGSAARRPAMNSTSA